MNKITVKINETKTYPMHNILGMNNSPRIKSGKNIVAEKKLFDALNLKFLRHHDAPLENPSFNLVDISRIFPSFHADENDEKNYFFAQTDDYFSVFADSNIELDFRVGETIDHSGFGRLIKVPEDINKWARICRNIIAHYKCGEMNGMHLNIKRVTVWEEPDHDRLLIGDVHQYSEMFCTLFKLLKAEFPDIRIGGPTIACDREFMKTFLENCRTNGVVPDYISHNYYRRDLKKFIEDIKDLRGFLDNLGFCDSSIIITEWHLGPTSWDLVDDEILDGFFNSKSASFCASTLIELEKIPYVEAVYYYAWATAMWAVFNLRTLGLKLLPVYYGLLFFQKLGAKCPHKLEAVVSDDDAVQVIAGKTSDGKIRVLASFYDGDDTQITFDGFDFSKCTLLSVKSDYSESDCINPVEPDNINGKICVNHTGKNGVYLLEFEK